jgi:F0F1-type ATP synthase gamma subunit
MSVRNVVKVMNFHALLRVNNARKKVERAFSYERELKYVIASIVKNRIFKQDNLSLEFSKNEKELNIYIGSDLGFCSSFNADVTSFIKEDSDENDKIIIGKRVDMDIPNKILYMDKENFATEQDKIFDIVLDGIVNKKYSKINIIYIHYYNLNKQQILKRTILPFDFGGDVLDEEEKREINKLDDYVVEGDLSFILLNLISLYVSNEVKIAEAWSWASENVERQVFTNESLKKIDEREEQKFQAARKARHSKEFKNIVEKNNKIRERKKEE